MSYTDAADVTFGDAFGVDKTMIVANQALIADDWWAVCDGW